MIVRRRPLAAEDIAGVWNHIADDSLRAADRWVDQLNEQFQLRSPGLFSWSYLEQGPQLWRVQIGKSATATPAASGSCCSGGACCG